MKRGGCPYSCENQDQLEVIKGSLISECIFTQNKMCKITTILKLFTLGLKVEQDSDFTPHVSLVKDGTKMKILSENKPLIFIMMNVCLFFI